MVFRPSKKFFLGFLALLLAGLFASRHLRTWPVRLRYPGEQALIEGMRLAEMQHLRRGEAIYAPVSPEKFDAAIYGPLYYLLGAQLVDPQKPSYFPLRVVSVVGTLGCAAACGLLAFWLSGSRLGAALAALIFLSYGLVTTFGISARCDNLALLFCFGGFLVAYRLQSSRTLLLAVPLMLVGLFYKQQFVAGPLAAVLFLLLERRYRRAGEFAVMLPLGGLGLLALFQFIAFPGQAFLHHFFVYNLLPFSWGGFVRGLWYCALLALIQLLVGLEFLRAYPSKLLGCYLGCALFLGLLTVAKVGSDANCFLECILMLSALFAALLARRIGEAPRAAELLILLGVALFFGQAFAQPAPAPKDFARDRAVQDFLRHNFPPGTRALGYYAGDLVRAGLESPISDFYQYGQLIRKGTLSDRELLAQFAERRFGVIVMYFDLRAEEVSRRADCQLAASLDLPGPEKFQDADRFYVWVPRPTDTGGREGARNAREKRP